MKINETGMCQEDHRSEIGQQVFRKISENRLQGPQQVPLRNIVDAAADFFRGGGRSGDLDGDRRIY
jgi:hypothetical protein